MTNQSRNFEETRAHSGGKEGRGHDIHAVFVVRLWVSHLCSRGRWGLWCEDRLVVASLNNYRVSRSFAFFILPPLLELKRLLWRSINCVSPRRRLIPSGTSAPPRSLLAFQATITEQEQRRIVVEALVDFIDRRVAWAATPAAHWGALNPS